ncbi:MAG: dihydroneopterin aldolase [Verrucomicrobiae bacterium]|nr:dihydroneopterin aldolase [Verrucomicrobiae bacterium]
MPDYIQVKGLKLSTRVGVPDEERATPQDIAVDVTIMPTTDLSGLNDDIERTIDYFQVAEALKRVAAEGERKLIETLAEDLAKATLEFERVEAVTVTIRKFILPETDWVSVTVSLPR